MSDVHLTTHVQDPARLAALRAVALLDTPTEEAFDRLSRLAARFLHAPVALVSLVDADRQFFKSCVGLPEPWCSRRQTPLSHSFCQHNRIVAEPLRVEDARAHAAFKDNPAIRDLNVVAYLGIPLVTSDGYVLGSFCVIDFRPRWWTDEEVAVVRDLAAAVMTEIQLRTEIATRKRVEVECHDLTALNARLKTEMAARERAEAEGRRLQAQMLQAQKLESLGVLAGGIAHDFNNLLTAMLGYGRLAADAVAADSPALPFLREVEQAAVRAAELVRQMLAYAGRARFVVGRCDLSRLVEDMSRLLGTVLSKKATLRLELTADQCVVRADAAQLRQVVMNLITNASDALGDQPGDVIVRTGVCQADADFLRSPYGADDLPAGDYVYLEVADTGAGMTPDTLARVFDPFFTTKAAGHGLGLAATLGIVRGHGGTLKVVSTPGRGSTFQIFLPRNEGAAAEPASAPAPEPWRGRGTVLLIEDDAGVRSLARAVLEGAGFHVLEAGDGREGVELFARHRQDIRLVLLDLTMPRQSGLEALAEMRTAQPEVRAILMSGYSPEEVTSRFADQKLAGFLAKPFTHVDLLAAVRKVLES